MRVLMSVAVFLLMVAIGMSLDWKELINRWRRHTVIDWIRLLVSTFVAPAAASLLLTHFLRLDREAVAGLFMVSVAPGAPLVTRNAAKRGFDLHLAASYQVWCASSQATPRRMCDASGESPIARRPESTDHVP